MRGNASECIGIPKSSNFLSLERPKNAIFKDMELNFVTHTNRDVSLLYSTFFGIFENFSKYFEK